MSLRRSLLKPLSRPSSIFGDSESTQIGLADENLRFNVALLCLFQKARQILGLERLRPGDQRLSFRLGDLQSRPFLDIRENEAHICRVYLGFGIGNRCVTR